ncbi:MAG: hypothetical protein IJR87_02925, partial [Bacteroidaceae bacterium]|nr:hypothetical protein [Bacteroidaceae bacterium]
AQTSLAFLSLTRSLELRSRLLTLGNAQTSLAFLSLTRSLELRSRLLTLGNAQTSLAFLSLTRSLGRDGLRSQAKGQDEEAE